MQKFKEMVEANLSGESAKDLVSSVKLAETRIGDLFRAAKAGYKAGHAAYKSTKKDLGRLRDGYKIARDAVSSGANVSSMIDKHKGKNSTTSFGSKSSVERLVKLKPSDRVSTSQDTQGTSVKYAQAKVKYAQAKGVADASADAMSDWARYKKGNDTETLPRMSKSSDSVSRSGMIPGIHAGQMGLKGDSVAAVTTNGKEKFVGVHRKDTSR